MKKLIAALVVLWCAHALGQTINPNQIRPAASNGQVLTTVTADQPPSWQPAGAGVSVAATSPCTVNGGAGPISSGTATIFCPGANLQMGYTQQGSGQYVLVFFTAHTCGTSGGSATCDNTSYAIGISGGATGSAGFSVPQLPTGIIASQITAIYPFAFKYQLNNIGGGDPTENGPLTFTGTSLAGCSPERSGSRNAASTPLQFGCQLTGTLTNFSTITAAMAGSTNFDEGGGTLGSVLVGMEIDYTGSSVTTPGTINCGSGLFCNDSSIQLLDYAIYPLTMVTLEGLPTQSNGTYNLVLDATSSTGPCSGSGGGTNVVWCVANGAGAYTAIPFGGAGVTWPSSGDLVISNGSPSPAGLAPVNGDCPIGASGAWTVAPCGSGAPGGSNTELQFNCSGIFCGDAYGTTDGAGNEDFNSVSTGANCSGCAGGISMTQGTAPGTTVPVNTIRRYAPTGVTAFNWLEVANGPPDSTHIWYTCAFVDSTHCAGTWANTPSGSFTAAGDLSGSSSSQEVVGIHSVPLCAGFTPTNGQAIEYTTGSSPNPCYTAATPSGGGNVVNLCSAVTLSSGTTCSGGLITVTPSASFIISAIPGTYLNLEIHGLFQTSDSSVDTVQCQFNGDTGADYSFTYMDNNSLGGPTTGQTSMRMGQAEPSSTSRADYIDAVIDGYTSTSLYKEANIRSDYNSSGPHLVPITTEWAPTSQAAITSMSCVASGGNISGTLTLYGMN